MGIGIRIFIFDNDTIKQIAYAKFDRLRNGIENESIPEYAGKRIRTAVVFVETEDRKPVGVLHLDCAYVSVDQDGKFDQSEEQQKMIDAMRCIDIPTDDNPPNVIDSSASFAIKKYRNKYLWTPTKEELRKIAQLIFKGHKIK